MKQPVRILAVGTLGEMGEDGLCKFEFDPTTDQATRELMKDLKGCKCQLVIPTETDGVFESIPQGYQGVCGLAIVEN